jgi:hypothetical protein
MILVQVTLQEGDCEQSRKQHLCAPHHLIYTGSHTQQSDVHQDGGHKVKE